MWLGRYYVNERLWAQHGVNIIMDDIKRVETYYILEHEINGYINIFFNNIFNEGGATRFKTIFDAVKERNRFGPSIRPFIRICELKTEVTRLEEKDVQDMETTTK